jgi:hypothetical protein
LGNINANKFGVGVRVAGKCDHWRQQESSEKRSLKQRPWHTHSSSMETEITFRSSH